MGKRKSGFPQVCIRCGYEWFSKVETPARCAKCYTPDFDKERKLIYK